MSIVEGKKIKIFSLSSNQKLALDIVNSLNLSLADLEVLRFADGEINVNIKETVRGHHVFVVQSTSNPVNEHLMELLIMCDALKRASAKTIHVIMPYYGYSRQDRKASPRQPISAKLVADLLQAVGVSRVISMDLHAPQIQGFFNIPIDNFLGLPVLVNYFVDKNLDNSDLCVVSPDHGGAVRAREFAKVLNCSISIIDKRRPEPNKAEVIGILGEVKDKVCILVDDMIDTAGSLCAGAEALLNAGAKKVYACATHAVFSGQAIERINNSCITEVVVTNTIDLPLEKQSPKVTVLSVGMLLGKGISKILSDEPLSGLFTYTYDVTKRNLL